jgi:hypothetical protein
MNKYIAVDNETGGLEGTSLLSTYLAVLDENLDVTAELDLKVKPNDGVYLVEAGGLEVNRIDLIAHDLLATTYSQAGAALRQFLIHTSDAGKIKLIPVGHGVTFDMISLRILLNRNTIEMYTSYRKLDTAIIAQYLKFCGRIPDHISGSLESLATWYNVVNVAYDAHTSKGDVLRTIAVLKAMKI